MAIFRKIHTSIWGDSFFSELDRDKKLFYIYLLTNERTKQCGVYEITIRQMCFDLGYTKDSVEKLLKYFTKTGKIKFNHQTNEIGIGNWLKFNSSTSPKVLSCINKEFQSVKDTLLIEYVKSMDTESQQEQEQEEEQEKEKEQDSLNVIFLNCDKQKQKILKTWIDYRKDLKKPITISKTLQSLVNTFNKEPLQKCIWTVNHSIENSYQGLFWDKYQAPKGEQEQSKVFKPSNNHRHG